MKKFLIYLLVQFLFIYTSGTNIALGDTSTISTSVGVFTLTTIDISSKDIVGNLSGQPWWGHEELAKEFANLAKLNFGTQYNQSCVGASFAFGLTDTEIKEVLWYQCGEGGIGISENGSVNVRGETNLTGIRTYAIATPENKPPIARAGSDVTIEDDEEPGEKVRLWAVGSDDKGIVKFEWVGSDGSKYSGARVDVNAPVGTTIYTLTVKDEEGLSDSDSLTVTVLEYKPKKEVPVVPQQSLAKITRTDGAETNSTISIGSSSDNGETYSTSFTVDDEVILTAKIYPDSNDVGEEGELYVVIRTVENGKKVFKALNEDGVWELWNASLKSLPAAKYAESLESVEEIEIYSGSMTVGQRLIYVGYSLFTDGKPVITTSLSPLKIDVSE
jgi:transcription elongation GreA/GreB family factor